jgi:hypothetical protein|tara:strand:+ start:482 stop:688 length:207 start_codon:yes stop_codon:yes gene_type:complete
LDGKIPTHEMPVECKEQTQFGELTWVINGHNYTFKDNEWIYPPQAGEMSLGQTGSSSSSEIPNYALFQ